MDEMIDNFLVGLVELGHFAVANRLNDCLAHAFAKRATFVGVVCKVGVPNSAYDDDRQFHQARLTGGRNLDQPIDGITGATLSVRAMTRMARVALLLDAHARGTVTDLATAR